MPDYNSIQTDRIENLTRRLLGVRNGGIVPAVSPELAVDLSVPQLEDVLPLAGYIRFGAGGLQGAVAAQYSYAAVSNLTPGSLLGVRLTGTLIVNGAIWFATSDATVAGALISPNNVAWLDKRRLAASFPLNANGVQIASSTSATAPPTTPGVSRGAGYITGLARVPITFPWCVLPPQTACLLITDSVNVDLYFSVEAWMRTYQPDELVI